MTNIAARYNLSYKTHRLFRTVSVHGNHEDLLVGVPKELPDDPSTQDVSLTEAACSLELDTGDAVLGRAPAVLQLVADVVLDSGGLWESEGLRPYDIQEVPEVS